MDSSPTTSPVHPESRSQASSWSDPWFYPFLAFFLLAVLLGLRLLFDYDLGFHLRGGQWILQNLAFPSTEPFTYTVPNHEYLDIHWLFQIILYCLYRLGGYSVISLVNVGLIVFLLFLTYQRLRLTHSPPWLRLLLLTAVLFTTENRFRARPEIWSWILMCLTLWVLELRALRKKDLLFLLPVFQLAWANAEGLFPLGWFLMGLYWFSDFVHNRKSDNKLLGCSLAAVAACLVNPYFFRGWCFPFTLLAELGTSTVFKKNIDEFQPTWAALFPPDHLTLIYELFFVLLLFFFLSTFRRRKIHEFFLAVVFFYLSLIAVRNVSLFMIACVPLAAYGWKDLKWNWLSSLQRAFLSKPLAAWAFALILLGLGLRVVTGTYYIQDRRPEHFGLGLDEGTQPVQACRFLSQNNLDGRILNQLGLGSWLDWQGPPGKTFIDGRLEAMGSEFFSEYMASFSPGGLKSLVEKYRPDILIMKTIAPMQWVLGLQKMPEWRLVYLDGVAAVFLRKGFGDGIPNLDYDRLFSENGISKTLVQEASAVIQQPASTAWKSFWEGFVKPVPYPFACYNMGFFLTATTGRPETAEPFFLEAIRRTSGKYHEFYYYLAGIYYSTQRKDEEAICMRQIAGDDPKQWQRGP